jgi:HSP20 family protein
MLRDLIPWSRGVSRFPIRREPVDLFTQLHREMNQLFEEVWRGFDVPVFGAGGRWLQPKTDVAETDKAIEVAVELPGLDEKDIDVSFADGVLTIKGEKKTERKDEGKGYHLAERSFGSFQRSLALPEGVDVDKVAAEFAKGVLTVRIPKLPELESKTKKIEIKSN